MKLWGKEYSRESLMKNVGDISQVCGVNRFVIDDGPGRGMRLFDVRTGGGMTFSVQPDRGMDISWCHYKDIPIGFISKTGSVSPYLCELEGVGFLRGFTAGLLTTCGYTYMGAACVDEGKPLGLHGPANALISAHTATGEGWDGDDYYIRINGTMREAAVFGENIQIDRSICVKAGENRLIIKDLATNCGFDRQPLMLLYHFNFGHPLVGPQTRLFTSEKTGVTPRDEIAVAGIDKCYEFQTPTHQYSEQVFYHDLIPDEEGTVFAGLYNESIGVGANIKIKKDELPYLIQWKQMGEGDYTCGIEPATWKPEGRAAARESGELQFIEPGEQREFNLEVEIITRPYV